jgi:F-type H+-transporting ATPase subunit b
MPAPLGFALINFAIFAAIMYRLAGRPLREFVSARHIGIKKELSEASELRRAADEKLKEAEARLAGIDQEIEKLVSGIRAEAEAEKARLIATAEAEAARIQRDAQALMASEMSRLERELRREVVDAALAAAEKMLREGVTADDQRKLTERYITGLESAPSPTVRS